MSITNLSESNIVTSVSGIISLLNEEEINLKIFGLEKLNNIVDIYWPELADYIFKIEELCEDKSFEGNELANLVVSKIYFHLEKYNEALKYALCSGRLFNLDEKSKYVETILAKCIDKYIEIRENTYDNIYVNSQLLNDNMYLNYNKMENGEDDFFSDNNWNSEINKRMELLVDEMLDVCIKNNNIKQALGVALDAKRLDKVKYIILKSPDKIEILQHSMKCEKHINASKQFRKDFYKLLVNIYLSLNEEELTTEYFNICECLFYIDDYKKVAEILVTLLEKNHLMAYQISFDLVDFENRTFLKNILYHIFNIIKTDKAFIIKEKETIENDEKKLVENDQKNIKETDEKKLVEKEQKLKKVEKLEKENDEKNVENQDQNNKIENGNKHSNEKNIDDADKGNFNTANDVLEYISKDHKLYEKLKKIVYILSGQLTINLYIEFLHRNNNADLVLLDIYKNVVDSRSSITHHGIILAHALMQAGTTCDVFLRSNIEWLSKAINWEKFSATASLGIVYKGHIKESFNMLSTYLPSDRNHRNDDNIRNLFGNNLNVGNINMNMPRQNSNVYSEGGSLYALGLIHANYKTDDDKVRKYLLQHLKTTNDEVIQHGCCLGLGLVCFSCFNDEEVYDELKSVMYSDSAVAGESAAYAIGLLKLGSGDEKCIDELLSYAHDTQHEKITRACGISIGFVLFQKDREANYIIEELINDKDAIIRYGGMFAIAMAYCGLSNYDKNVIKKLLHYSVSDVNDDVRRAAVIALGFVLCNTPNEVPKLLNLLIESYNPHVRYGAALALGIACAGTGNEEAINMLMSLLTDGTDFVRQSAFIALGLIFQVSNEHVNVNFNKFKDEIMKILSDKHEDIIAKFGAVVSAGLLDICGRNAVSTFFTRKGNMIRPQAAVGFCLFTQLWYWFPLIHMISLTFLPTCLIGLTDNLQMPKNFKVICNNKSSHFDYPSFFNKEKIQEKKENVTAVLSTTSKKKGLKIKKQKNEKIKTETNVNTSVTHDKSAQDDNSSVLSDGKSMKNLDVLSTAATVGQSSHVSHSGSIAGSTNEENANEQADNMPNIQKTKKENKARFAPITTVDMKNPCRVIKIQEKYIEYLPDGRYKPILPSRKSGFIILHDNNPDEPSEYIETKIEKEIILESTPFDPFVWKEN